MIFEIQQLVLFIQHFVTVLLQFVPGHRSIEGNELADLAAKAAHGNEIINTFVPREDKVRCIHPVLMRQWERHWHANVLISGKGIHLKNVKQNLGDWEWACQKERMIESVFSKLRIGHLNTKEHLFRFNLTQSPYCECGMVENIYHIFMECTIYNRHRESLKRELIRIGVSYNIRNMLGGGPFESSKQNQIIQHVAEYLRKIDKLNRL